jgi:predicted dehydrogenase
VATSAPGRILIAGFGSIGRRHFRNLRQLGCADFVFLRSRLGTLDDGEIAEYPSAVTIADALAYAPTIAIVATPSALHVDLALAAAEAGCDLYIEKPLSADETNLNRLLATVRERKCVAMVGCQFRFHPLLLDARAMITSGGLGNVAGAAAEWGEYLPAWHPWEDHRRSYSSRRDLGGGVLLTLIHPFDYLHWLFGPARRAQATIARIPSLETPAGEDWADVNLAFRNGVSARVHLDYLQRPTVHRLTIIGERGRLECDFQTGELRSQPVDGPAQVKAGPPGFERNTMFLDAMSHFLGCVRDRSEPRVPLADGVAVLRTVLEARRGATETTHV